MPHTLTLSLVQSVQPFITVFLGRNSVRVSVELEEHLPKKTTAASTAIGHVPVLYQLGMEPGEMERRMTSGR